MKYLGMDVHSHASVWCLLDQKGEKVDRGKTVTVRDALQHLVTSLDVERGRAAGRAEVGTMSHYVHDALTDAGADSFVQRAAPAHGFVVAEKDGPAGRVLDREGATDGAVPFVQHACPNDKCTKHSNRPYRRSSSEMPPKKEPG